MLLIYGATGDAGGLLAEEARRRGRGVVVPGGRSEATLRPLAERLGHPFSLDQPDLSGSASLTGVTLQDRP